MTKLQATELGHMASEISYIEKDIEILDGYTNIKDILSVATSLTNEEYDELLKMIRLYTKVNLEAKLKQLTEKLSNYQC